MIDLHDYFDPVSIDRPDIEFLSGPASFSHNVFIHTENTPVNDISKYKIAILGVPDGRYSASEGTSEAPDRIRQMLYRLSRIQGKIKIADLGNMKQGLSFGDTVAGLADVVTYLRGMNVFPLIIGGSSALVSAIDRSYTSRNLNYSLLSVDSRIDFHPEKKEPVAHNWIYPLLYNTKGRLKQFTGIGYQTYLNDLQIINRLSRRKAELMRIGDVRSSMHQVEPLMRDSDVVIFDIGAVRQSDAPGSFSPSPNGFYGEEICLLARYAGISDSINVFGLFEVNPALDFRDQTSALAAQIIWFFLEGFSHKQFELHSLHDPLSGRFTRYHVRITDLSDELVFVKSNLTERWWMEIAEENGKCSFIACSHEDYLQANRNEVPEKWVKASIRFKK
jgi:arginase family enzyme